MDQSVREKIGQNMVPESTDEVEENHQPSIRVCQV